MARPAQFHYLAATVLVAALIHAAPSHAQSYQGAVSDESEAGDTSFASERTSIDPYIEANSIASWQISPDSDVVTYTQLAAGVDAAIVIAVVAVLVVVV